MCAKTKKKGMGLCWDVSQAGKGKRRDEGREGWQ